MFALALLCAHLQLYLSLKESCTKCVGDRSDIIIRILARGFDAGFA